MTQTATQRGPELPKTQRPTSPGRKFFPLGLLTKRILRLRRHQVSPFPIRVLPSQCSSLLLPPYVPCFLLSSDMALFFRCPIYVFLPQSLSLVFRPRASVQPMTFQPVVGNTENPQENINLRWRGRVASQSAYTRLRFSDVITPPYGGVISGKQIITPPTAPIATPNQAEAPRILTLHIAPQIISDNGLDEITPPNAP